MTFQRVYLIISFTLHTSNEVVTKYYLVMHNQKPVNARFDKGIPRYKDVSVRPDIIQSDASYRVRVVSNFNGGDCVAGEIHTRAHAKSSTFVSGLLEVSRARVCVFRLPHKSPSPKLETTRSLASYFKVVHTKRC